VNYLQTKTRFARLAVARKRGVTLIEAVLYISIALALIVGGLVFFQQASLAQRVNGAVRNISAIASETRGLYQASANFTGLTTTTLINAGAVPTSLVSGSTLSNEWGGDIAVAVATNADQFTVTYENVPTAACTRLATVDNSGSGRVGSGVVSVAFRNAGTTTGDVVVTPVTTSGSPAVTSSTLTPAAAATRCTTAANGATQGSVDLTYTFSR
jgi:hypothetical protein